MKNLKSTFVRKNRRHITVVLLEYREELNCFPFWCMCAGKNLFLATGSKKK